MAKADRIEYALSEADEALLYAKLALRGMGEVNRAEKIDLVKRRAARIAAAVKQIVEACDAELTADANNRQTRLIR